MSDLIMFDAATLDKINETTLHKPDAWAGYISGAAEHIWTNEEWHRVSAFPKLPIVVARANNTGTYCGLEAIMAIFKLGIPRSTAIAYDPELFFDPQYFKGTPEEAVDAAINSVAEFYKVMTHFGFLTWKYGSTSWLFKLPPVDGSWVATDSGEAKQYPHSGVHATQYAFDSLLDESVIHRIAVHHRLSESWAF